MNNRIKIFLNIANGIEAIDKWGLKNFAFIRLQSTAAEQHRWDFIIQDLDNNLLMELAIGSVCIILDGSHKNYPSRALYQAIPWIRYVLERYWLGEVKTTPEVKRHNVEEYFAECYKNLNKRTFMKLKYFKKFLNTDSIKLIEKHFHTYNDGKYEKFKRIVSKL